MDERQKAELEMHAALLSYYRSPKEMRFLAEKLNEEADETEKQLKARQQPTPPQETGRLFE